MMSAYMLLFFHWLENFFFSHLQFMYISKITFRRHWRIIFVIISGGLYSILGTLYVLLLIKPSQFEDSICMIIQYATASGDFFLPLSFGITWFYYAVFILSGFPYSSNIARERFNKISSVLLVWTVGRLIRGVLLILIMNEYM